MFLGGVACLDGGTPSVVHCCWYCENVTVDLILHSDFTYSCEITVPWVSTLSWMIRDVFHALIQLRGDFSIEFQCIFGYLEAILTCDKLQQAC